MRCRSTPRSRQMAPRPLTGPWRRTFLPGQDERRKLPTRPLRGAEPEGGGGAASIEGRVCVRAWRSMSEGRRKVLLLVEKAKVVKDDSGEEDE